MNPPQRLTGLTRLELAWVREMGHERNLLAALANVFEESQQVVRIPIGDESVGPVGQRLGADPNRPDVLETGGEKGLDVSCAAPSLT